MFLSANWRPFLKKPDLERKIDPSFLQFTFYSVFKILTSRILILLLVQEKCVHSIPISVLIKHILVSKAKNASRRSPVLRPTQNWVKLCKYIIYTGAIYYILYIYFVKYILKVMRRSCAVRFLYGETTRPEVRDRIGNLWPNSQNPQCPSGTLKISFVKVPKSYRKWDEGWVGRILNILAEKIFEFYFDHLANYVLHNMYSIKKCRWEYLCTVGAI